MGGVDADNVTAQVLRELEKFNLPNNIEIVVVMGGTAPHLESIKAQVNDFPYTTEVKVNINNMAEIMANADIAIGAAGATTWERCCLGLPTIQIAIAKNQEFSAEALANNNIVKPLTSLGGIQNLLKTSAEWMIPTSKAAAQVCDGMGVYRVLSELNHNKITLEKFGEVELHNYVNLTLDEKALVLDMRNHPEVKKWMHNQDEILQKTHFEFIQNLKNNATRKYFLVKQRHKTIGSINFSKIESRKTSVEFGIYTNPFESLQGAGRILETIATYYAFKRLGVSKLKLEVYSNNERAINFYNKCGFVLAKTKKVNGKGLLYMEKTKVLSGINDQDD
jgi:UDP-4-amino-4,6-dideoxy-N-acetyl-beta-L-altrosamine N-acetyltransferase